MQRYAVSFVKRYTDGVGTFAPLSQELQCLFKSNSENTKSELLTEGSSVALRQYFLNKDCPIPTSIERKYLLYFLNQWKAYSVLVDIGKRFLFVRNNAETTTSMHLPLLHKDASKTELLIFLHSILNSGNLNE